MDKHLKFARAFSKLLDEHFNILGFKFGLDPILGFLPGLGDFLTFVFSMYIIWIGIRMELPKEKISRMVRNVMVDFVIGLMPIIGDLGDFVFKSNVLNLTIIHEHIKNKEMNRPAEEGKLIA